MVSSGTVSGDASSLRAVFTSYSGYISGIGSSWEGPSADNLKQQANDFIGEAESIASELDSFSNACSAYEKYIEAKRILETATTPETYWDQLRAAIKAKQTTYFSALSAYWEYKRKYDGWVTAKNTAKNNVTTYLSQITFKISDAASYSASAAEPGAPADNAEDGTDAQPTNLAASNLTGSEAAAQRSNDIADDLLSRVNTVDQYGGKCPVYICEAIQAQTGVWPSCNHAQELNSNGSLEAAGYVRVEWNGDTNYQFQPGDVVVCNGDGVHGNGVSGHVQMYTSQGWVSDTRQSSLLLYNNGNYLYRYVGNSGTAI